MIAVFVPELVRYFRGGGGVGTRGADDGDGGGSGYGFTLINPRQTDGTGSGYYSYRRRGVPALSGLYLGPSLLKESTWFTSVYLRP